MTFRKLKPTMEIIKSYLMALDETMNDQEMRLRKIEGK